VRAKLPSPSGTDDLVPIRFAVTPAVKAKLEELAEQSGKSVSEVASIILMAQIKEHQKLEASLRKAVAEAFDEEFNRIMSPLLRLFPFLQGNGKKQMPN
jgi:fido (protein-threonine AMPylation protein)